MAASTGEAPLKLFIDTNVWLDNYLGDRPRNRSASDLLGFAGKAGAALLFTVSSANDVFFLLTQNLKGKIRAESGRVTAADAAAVREIAWGCIENMAELGTSVSLGMGDIWYAEKLRGLHDDFEDNLILAAAVRVKADFLVTSDERLQRHSPVATFSPDDMLAYLKTQE